MEEHLEKFLVKVGLPEDIVSQFKDVDEENPPDVDTLASEWKQHQREVFQNDPEIIKTLKSEMRGKERGSVERSIMRTFGITAEEARENGLENDYDKLLKFSKAKLEKTSSKTAGEIQEELQKANLRIKEFEDDVIPGLKEKGKKEIDQFYIRNFLNDLALSVGEVTVKPKLAVRSLEEGLREHGYVVNLLDNRDGIDIKTKDGLTPQNKDKTKNLTPKELAYMIFEEDGILKQSKADPDRPPAPAPTPVPDDVYARMPHLKKAREHEKNVPRWVGRGTAKFKE